MRSLSGLGWDAHRGYLLPLWYWVNLKSRVYLRVTWLQRVGLTLVFLLCQNPQAESQPNTNISGKHQRFVCAVITSVTLILHNTRNILEPADCTSNFSSVCPDIADQVTMASRNGLSSVFLLSVLYVHST